MPTRSEAEQVECPNCGSPAGEPCLRARPRYQDPNDPEDADYHRYRAHRERHQAYLKNKKDFYRGRMGS